MKRLITLFTIFALICMTGCVTMHSSRSRGFCPTYTYEGFYRAEDGTQQNITVTMMKLLNKTMLGSYYIEGMSRDVYKLGGQMNKDRTFSVDEWVNDSVSYVWNGTQSADGKSLWGTRTELSSGKVYDFSVQAVFGKSYWDYIRKNRGYKEYTDLEKAVKHSHDVLSIDVANQGLTTLPNDLAKLDRIESINLLGNKFDTFPPVLAEMTTLDEISLCQNGLSYIGPEIGKLKKLRILILSSNKLKTLPKEIGELTNLLYLDLDWNPLKSLPEEIKNLTSLQELHIRNGFTEEQKNQIQEWLPNCKILFDYNP